MTPRFNTRSLATRLILGSAVWIVAALVVGGLLLASLFQGHVQRIFDDRQVIMLDSLIVVTRVNAACRCALAVALAVGSNPETARGFIRANWRAALHCAGPSG